MQNIQFGGISDILVSQVTVHHGFRCVKDGKEEKRGDDYGHGQVNEPRLKEMRSQTLFHHDIG